MSFLAVHIALVLWLVLVVILCFPQGRQPFQAKASELLTVYGGDVLFHRSWLTKQSCLGDQKHDCATNTSFTLSIIECLLVTISAKMRPLLTAVCKTCQVSSSSHVTVQHEWRRFTERTEARIIISWLCLVLVALYFYPWIKTTSSMGSNDSLRDTAPSHYHGSCPFSLVRTDAEEHMWIT